MKAAIYTKYGGPEVLQIKEVEKPYPKDNEVLIKVRAVSINDWDWQLLLGLPVAGRIFSGVSTPKQQILGSDIAGQIEAVGKEVKQFKEGDEVYGDISGIWGGFAGYARAPENKIRIKPAGMSFEQAAAIPQAGMLAVQALRAGNIQPGQKILINGAGGGVGTFAVQIARLYDVELTGVDNTGKMDMLRSMGFDHVIDYTKEDFTKNGKQYHLVIDVKTNRSIFEYARALYPNGMYATVGGSLRWLLQCFLLRPWISRFRKKNMRVVMLKPNKDLGYMEELFESGKMKPVIDGSYKLDDIAKAFDLFSKGAHKGKLVITI